MRYERQLELYEILKERGSASIAELAALLYTSEASVRRDVAALEAKGLVTKVYGGVVLASYRSAELPLSLRDAENAKEKDVVAEKAASLVEDNMTIILDSSSTVRRIVKYLTGVKGLRIITNNIAMFADAAELDCEIYCTGGIYNKKGTDLLGPSAESYFSGISADILFFSAEGVTEDGEITDVSEARNSLRRIMISRAKRSYFLCDSSKIGYRRTFTLCHTSELDGVICDAPFDPPVKL